MPTEPIPTDVLDEVERAWPLVLQLIREYDEAFPYASQDDDDENVYRMRMALVRLREARRK